MYLSENESYCMLVARPTREGWLYVLIDYCMPKYKLTITVTVISVSIHAYRVHQVCGTVNNMGP